MRLPEFKDEAQFRTEWIAPFLSKLGYILPTHVHGPHEQGKDFFFADHDKFGHLRFYSAQVKCGNIGAGNTETDELLNQVRRSFKVTLKYHKNAHLQRVSAVYILASGTISVAALEYIRDSCREEHYGENVFWIDGETLYNLDRHATYEDDRSLRLGGTGGGCIPVLRSHFCRVFEGFCQVAIAGSDFALMFCGSQRQSV
jgi:hypothetical protein